MRRLVRQVIARNASVDEKRATRGSCSIRSIIGSAAWTPTAPFPLLLLGEQKKWDSLLTA